MASQIEVQLPSTGPYTQLLAVKFPNEVMQRCVPAVVPRKEPEAVPLVPVFFLERNRE